jgi:nicotinamide-nucleotide amidase
LTQPKAFVLVTGSELVRGDRPDLNGPFLARELASVGFEPTRIVVVGDSESELEAALREGLAADLCVISGGLGPTHDDRTIDVLARVTSRDLIVDSALEREIETVSRGIAERLRRPYGDFVEGVRKQASLPSGAISVGLAGTAPGVVLETDGGVAVALPGPPAELRRLWALALETGPLRELVARASPPERRLLRFYGVSESAVARALADAGGEGEGVEATICARDFEIHVDLLARAGGERRARELEDVLASSLERHLFARDERSVEELVLERCRDRGFEVATAESCTGGLVAARLTSVPGASDVFVGGIVAYSDGLKQRELGVPTELLERHGAVSAECAAAMCAGARVAFDASVAVSVTGIAGPSGGTPQKPVGLVYLHAIVGEEELDRELIIPGDRETIRRRATVTALHLLLRLLTPNSHKGV